MALKCSYVRRGVLVGRVCSEGFRNALSALGLIVNLTKGAPRIGCVMKPQSVWRVQAAFLINEGVKSLPA